MADNPRIEDLRKRYHENPRRFFAPLANEYRKGGFLDRAILLCEKHLGEQPENMNGLVVYGQTLFESGRPEDARVPFERALGLDPENLIALRHLGDIARLVGDAPEARKWYQRVLEYDRRNDEVLEILEQMGEGVASEDDTAPIEEPKTARFDERVDPSSLISVAGNVSIAGSDSPELGMIELDEAPRDAAASKPKAPAGPGKTAVIDAQALADRDRLESAAQVPDPAGQPSAGAASKTVEVTPPALTPPAARGSLLDIDFDFSEGGEPAETPAPAPTRPVGDEAAGDEFSADALPAAAPGADAPVDETLIVETTSSGEALSTTAPTGVEGLELAEFSAEAAPLAGLETTEFTSEDVAPLADLDRPDVTAEDVAPLADLDRPEVTMEDVAPLADLDRVDVVAENVAPLEGLGHTLPELDEAPALEELPIDEPPSYTERPSAPRPRMTKSDLASLPLIADFGLEDDAPAGSGAAEAPPAPRASRNTPSIVTETMATLYLQQGHRADAINVYRQLVQQAPADETLRAKLAALEAEEMPEFEVPPADAAEPEPAPRNAAMSDVSFSGLGLRTPTPAAGVRIPEPSGPSAREFFGSFARRGVARGERAAAAEPVAESVAESVAAAAAPTHTPVADTGWPMDALLGLADDAADESAAIALAGIGTFAGPSGGSGLDELFAAAPAAEPEAAPPPRKSVPRASQNLKFDQFFQGGSPSSGTPAVEPGGEDDVDQFQDWLKGLKP